MADSSTSAETAMARRLYVRTAEPNIKSQKRRIIECLRKSESERSEGFATAISSAARIAVIPAVAGETAESARAAVKPVKLSHNS